MKSTWDCFYLLLCNLKEKIFNIKQYQSKPKKMTNNCNPEINSQLKRPFNRPATLRSNYPHRIYGYQFSAAIPAVIFLTYKEQ